MSSSRLAPLSGLAGLLLVVLGLATDRAPDSSWGEARTHAWFVSHSLVPWLVSATFIALGGVLLLVFAAVLTARQEQAGAGPVGRYLTLVAGSAWGLLTMVGGAGFGTIPVAHVFMNAEAPTANTYHVLGGLFYGILVAFCAFAAALLALTLGLTSRVTGLLPRWLTRASVPAAVLMLANALMPMAVLTLYFATVSIVLARRQPQSASGTSSQLLRERPGQRGVPVVAEAFDR
jgi:hypothetical protein